VGDLVLVKTSERDLPEAVSAAKELVKAVARRVATRVVHLRRQGR